MDITWIEALLWISLLSFPAAFLLTIGSKSPSLEKLEVLFKIQSINNLDKIKTTSDHCLIHLDKISLDEQLIDVGTTIEIPSGFHQAYTVNVNPIPVFFITGFNPGVCTEATGHIEVTGLAPNTNYTINYIDDAQPVGPLSLTSNGTGLITFPNLDAGSYEYFNVVISATGCSTLSLLNTSLLNST